MKKPKKSKGRRTRRARRATLHVRVTAEEHARATVLAKQARQSLSRWARRTLGLEREVESVSQASLSSHFEALERLTKWGL